MPGRAADQHERARHEAAAEHAVELADAGAHARHRRGLDLGERDRPHRLARAPWPPARARPARCSSTNVFHSPQPGQRPCHLALSCPQAEQTKRVLERAIPARLSARVDGFAPAPRKMRLPSVWRRSLHRLGGAARATCGRRGVRGAGHRDQRPRRRALRAHRGGRGARRRGRAARDLRLARAPGAAAVARHPALHRHHPGDGRRRAAAGGGAAGRGAAARGASARGPQRELRPARAAPGLRAGRDRLAGPARSCAPSSSRGSSRRWPAAGPRAAGGRASASRSTRCTGRSPTRSPARASSARSSRACARTPPPWPTRSTCSGARRRARKTEPAERIPPVRAPGPVHAARRPGRVRVPRRPRPAALRGQVGVAALPRAGPLLRPRRLDRARRDRGLPAHQLRAGRARAREPADQGVAAGRATAS